jgi:hypothetical protein
LSAHRSNPLNMARKVFNFQSRNAWQVPYIQRGLILLHSSVMGTMEHDVSRELPLAMTKTLSFPSWT